MSGYSVSVYTRSGSPYWWARCYLAGEGDTPRRWSTGVRLDDHGGRRGSRRVATQRAEEHAARLAAAVEIQATTEADLTLNAVARRMLRQKTVDGRRKRAVASHAHNLRKHVEPFFGARRDVRTIGRPDLEAFKRHLFTAKLAPTTINNCLTAVRQVLKQALDEGRLESLPYVKNVEVPEDSKGRALTPDEIDALLSSVDPRALEAQQFLLFIANTGLRKEECLAMRWKWIDFERAVLYVPAEYRKGGAARKGLPLNDIAMAVLTHRKEHGTKYTGRKKVPLFTGPEDRVWIQVKHDVARNSAAERAGLGRVRTHDLRHTFGSLAHANGASLPEVRDLLGHKTLVMVNRYAHTYEERLRAAAQRVLVGRPPGAPSTPASVSGSVSGEGSNPAQQGSNPTHSRKRRALKAVK